MDLLNTVMILGGGGGIAGVLGWMFLKDMEKKFSDVGRIPSLESRVAILEQQAIAHNDTKEAVIRLETKVEGLTEQVRNLTDLLMRKVFANG